MMWDGINDSQETKRDLAWIADRMSSNSLIWTTDGSHDRKKVADLCGVGWVIFCTKTGLRLTRNFWERLQAASSYRAEMLGLCALHLLARAVADSIRYKGDKQHCAVTINELWIYHLTSKVGYVQAPNAQTSGGIYG